MIPSFLGGQVDLLGGGDAQESASFGGIQLDVDPDYKQNHDHDPPNTIMGVSSGTEGMGIPAALPAANTPCVPPWWGDPGISLPLKPVPPGPSIPPAPLVKDRMRLSFRTCL